MIHVLLLIIAPLVCGDRVVQTNSGPVRGISLDEKNVEAFLGIPYAEPPVGNLRFKKPAPKSPWTETYDAKQVSHSCIQSMTEIFLKFYNETIKTDEDCLYLNLWVPKTDSALKPVMVFIYGGGFMTGTASMKLYDGAALSQQGDVIVASMNYRVGTLGFFSAFTDEIAGNMGMYDQVLAIQWIKDNAKHFGGDPDNIVLFGESAGAFSIGLHMVSPLSKNLFNRAIQQSGSAINPMYSDGNEVLRMGSQTISTLVGCAENNDDFNDNPQKVVECMKSLPADKFPEAEEVLVKKLAFLLPRVGDEFLPKNPIDSFRNGEFRDTDLLIGLTRDEGSFFISFQLGFESGKIFGEDIDPKSFNESTARQMVKSLDTNEHNHRIIQKYFKRVKKESRYSYLNAVSDIVGDTTITCGTVFQADFQSKKCHPVYFYVFDYRSPSSPFADWIGVPHFEEVQYVFGNRFLKTLTENEKELSKDIIDMWAAFAKKGNPNIPGGLKWPKYTYKDPKYLVISMRDKVGLKPDNYRCEAWRDNYRSTVHEDDF